MKASYQLYGRPNSGSFAVQVALESHVQLVSRRPAVLKVEADHGG